MKLPDILTHLLALALITYNLKRRMINERPDDPTDPAPLFYLAGLLALLWSLP